MLGALDCAMGVRQQSSLLFSSLQPAMQRVLQRSVQLAHIRQIAFIMPDCYRLQLHSAIDDWGRASVDYRVSAVSPLGSSSASTAMSAASSSQLTQRKQQLEQSLLDLVRKEHSSWWARREQEAGRRQWDADVEGRWHPDFPLESCAAVGMVELRDSEEKSREEPVSLLERLTASREAERQRLTAARTPSSAASTASNAASDALPDCPATPSSRPSSLRRLTRQPGQT